VATEEDILARVEEALARDGAWRAKEILRGNIRICGYSPALYKRYGELLLSVGERYEAGKYLFLSNARSPEHEDAIALFTRRHRRAKPATIIAALPKGARLERASQYPEPLRSELGALGVKGRVRRKEPAASGPPGLAYRALVGLGCIVLLFAVIILAAIGWEVLTGQGR
jgi:hypothetical protein